MREEQGEGSRRPSRQVAAEPPECLRCEPKDTLPTLVANPANRVGLPTFGSRWSSETSVRKRYAELADRPWSEYSEAVYWG